MADESQSAGRQISHGMRIFAIWLVVSVVVDLLIGFVLAPHLPPGTMSSAALDQQDAINLMALLSAPVFPVEQDDSCRTS